MSRVTPNTLIPVSLLVTIVLASVHATIMWTKMMNRLDSVASNQVTIADIQQYSWQMQQLNPGQKCPDIMNIIQQRKSLYESAH